MRIERNENMLTLNRHNNFLEIITNEDFLKIEGTIFGKDFDTECYNFDLLILKEYMCGNKHIAGFLKECQSIYKKFK